MNTLNTDLAKVFADQLLFQIRAYQWHEKHIDMSFEYFNHIELPIQHWFDLSDLLDSHFLDKLDDCLEKHHVDVTNSFLDENNFKSIIVYVINRYNKQATDKIVVFDKINGQTNTAQFTMSEKTDNNYVIKLNTLS